MPSSHQFSGRPPAVTGVVSVGNGHRFFPVENDLDGLVAISASSARSTSRWAATLGCCQACGKPYGGSTARRWALLTSRCARSRGSFGYFLGAGISKPAVASKPLPMPGGFNSRVRSPRRLQVSWPSSARPVRTRAGRLLAPDGSDSSAGGSMFLASSGCAWASPAPVGPPPAYRRRHD